MNFTDVSFTSRVAPATTRYVGWGNAFLDFDNDGWPDLFLVDGHVYPQVDQIASGPKYREPALLFLNERTGTFQNVTQMVGPAIQVPRVSRGVAVGDLFNNGRMDVVIENLQGQPTILRPEGGPANHWINFQLEGAKSNRLALNARVRITAETWCRQAKFAAAGVISRRAICASISD